MNARISKLTLVIAITAIAILQPAVSVNGCDYCCGPDNQDFVCGERCEDRSCVSDIYTPCAQTCGLLAGGGGCDQDWDHGCCRTTCGF